MRIIAYCRMRDRALLWLGPSREDVRAFPADARRIAGFQLHRVQQGLAPNDWKPMAAIGSGVSEIRIHTAVEHRVVYVAKFVEAVYVLHAFKRRVAGPPSVMWIWFGKDCRNSCCNGEAAGGHETR